MTENAALETCDCRKDNITCSTVSTQYADVGVLVKLQPFSKVGRIQSDCCGDPVISCYPCQNCESHSCEFTIMQSLCIHIPIEYGATVDVRESMISCCNTDEDECKCHCDYSGR